MKQRRDFTEVFSLRSELIRMDDDDDVLIFQLGERGRFPRTSIGYNQSSQRLRSQYGELSSVVQTLRETLSTSGLNLTSLELNRRRNLLENLARKCGTVREQLTELGPVSGAATRSQLLADLGTSSWAASPSPLETNKRVVPNRTGVRENNRSVVLTVRKFYLEL